MSLFKPTRRPTDADAEKAHKLEKQRTEEAIRETERMERDRHPNLRPAESAPWAPSKKEHAHG